MFFSLQKNSDLVDISTEFIRFQSEDLTIVLRPSSFSLKVNAKALSEETTKRVFTWTQFVLMQINIGNKRGNGKIFPGNPAEPLGLSTHSASAIYGL